MSGRITAYNPQGEIINDGKQILSGLEWRLPCVQVDAQFVSVNGGAGTDTLFLLGTTGRTLNLAAVGVERILQGSGGVPICLMVLEWLYLSPSMETVTMIRSPVAVLTLFRFTAIGESVVGVGRDTISGFDAVGVVLEDRVDANLAADFEILVQDGAPVAANWVAGDFFL